MVRGLRGRGQGLDAIGEVVASPVIINLRAQEMQMLREEAELRSLYGERHPKMQELAAEKANIQGKIDAEVTRITTVLENDVAVAAARVADDREPARRLQEPQHRESRCRGPAARARAAGRRPRRTLYEAFLARSKEIREQQEIAEPDARLVAIATPPSRPSTPERQAVRRRRLPRLGHARHHAGLAARPARPRPAQRSRGGGGAGPADAGAGAQARQAEARPEALPVPDGQAALGLHRVDPRRSTWR